MLKYCRIPDPCDRGIWHEPDAEMPYPHSKSTGIENTFSLCAYSELDDIPDNFDTPLEKPKTERDFTAAMLILIVFNSKWENGVAVSADRNLIKDIDIFLKRLDSEGYSNLQEEDFGIVSFAAWKKNGYIRFIVQTYPEDICYEPRIYIDFDCLVPEHIFYAEFDRLKKKIEFFIDQRKNYYKRFKETEKMLNSLHWEYKKGSINPPCETADFENHGEISAFAEMARKEQQKNERIEYGKYIYRVSEKKNRLTRFIEYYDDIAHFLRHSGFVPRQGITLSGIMEEMNKQGWNTAIRFKIGNKKLIMLANGMIRHIAGHGKSREFVPKTAKEAEKIAEFKQILHEEYSKCGRKNKKLHSLPLEIALENKGFYPISLGCQIRKR